MFKLEKGCNMTEKMILKKLDEINHIATIDEDDECAHIAEDNLYIDFIYSITTRKGNSDELRKLARLVLSSQNIEFNRCHS